MLALLAQTSNSNPFAVFIMFALIGGLFYLFLLRPQQKRVKAQQALISSVDVGDDIVTTAGIYGTITSIDEDDGTLTVQIAPGVEIQMLRAGIGRLAHDADEDDDEGDAYEDDDDEVLDASDAAQEYPDQPGQIKEL
jgi:preprotein translocase subunit YajC